MDSRSHKRWTEEEIARLQMLRATEVWGRPMPYEEIARRMPGRSTRSIALKLSRLEGRRPDERISRARAAAELSALGWFVRPPTWLADYCERVRDVGHACETPDGDGAYCDRPPPCPHVPQECVDIRCDDEPPLSRVVPHAPVSHSGVMLW